MGVCGCVIPSPDCHCHFTPVSDWQHNNSTNHLVTMPKSVLDQIGKEHTEEVERLRQQVADLVEALNNFACTCPYAEGCSLSECGSIARDAIAKATGGE